ncbi:MAG: glycosyltransferase, partial [Gemmataceae bacterium]
HLPGETILVAGTLSLSGRIAAEKLGMPLVTVHLQPMAIKSIETPPVFPTMRLPRWLPRVFVRLLYWYADTRVIQPLLDGPVNGFRAELGLPRQTRIWGEWRHSTSRILNLFPAWFASAPDWPQQTICTNFIRYDQGTKAMPPGLSDFLTQAPPVVVTFGSAMRQAGIPFAAATEAIRLADLPGLLLARGTEQVPQSLPAKVRHFEYAPFGEVFPRSRVVIHHGGIGTTAQALAAGVPQIIMPMAFDQYDTAARLEALGVAITVRPAQFTPARVQAALSAAEALRTRCAEVATRLTGPDGAEASATVVEDVLRATAPALALSSL